MPPAPEEKAGLVAPKRRAPPAAGLPVGPLLLTLLLAGAACVAVWSAVGVGGGGAVALAFSSKAGGRAKSQPHTAKHSSREATSDGDGDEPGDGGSGKLHRHKHGHADGGPSVPKTKHQSSSAAAAAGSHRGGMHHRRPSISSTKHQGPAAALTGRGFSDGKAMAAHADFELLDKTSWWYDWSLNPAAAAGGHGGFRQEFVAMAWGRGMAAELPGWTPHPSTRNLMGFNEPNLHSQANMTAEQACALWPPVLAAARRHGLSVGSPSANHCAPGGGGQQDSNCFMTATDWLDAFFALPGCGVGTVDFLTTHKYGGSATDTIDYLTMLRARYGKPVWLTEFAEWGMPAPHAKVDSQLELMRELLPWLDAHPTVVPRYAWFQAHPPVASEGGAAVPPGEVTWPLLAGGKLTALGAYYNGEAE